MARKKREYTDAVIELLANTDLSYNDIADKINEDTRFNITDQTVYYIKKKYLPDLDRDKLKEQIKKKKQIEKLKRELEKLKNNNDKK